MAALRPDENKLLIAVCSQLKGANFAEVAKELGINQSAASKRWNRLYTKILSKNPTIRAQDQTLLVAVCKQTANGMIDFDKVATEMKLSKSVVTKRWGRLRAKLCGGDKTKDGVKGAKVQKATAGGAAKGRGRPKKGQSQNDSHESQAEAENENEGEAMGEDEGGSVAGSESKKGASEGGDEEEAGIDRQLAEQLTCEAAAEKYNEGYEGGDELHQEELNGGDEALHLEDMGVKEENPDEHMYYDVDEDFDEI